VRVGSFQKFAEHQIPHAELSVELWPVLARRLELARTRGTDSRIPIVRVLDRAIVLAQDYPAATSCSAGAARVAEQSCRRCRPMSKPRLDHPASR